MKILVFAEHADGKGKKSAHEILSKAKELGATVVAACLGANVGDVASDLANYGASQVIVVDNPGLEKYNSVAYAKAFEAVVNEVQPNVVLASASPEAKDFLPRVSAKLKAGLASDCVDLSVDGDKLVAKKPVYSGKAFAKVTFNSPIQMATVRPNSFPIVEAGGSAESNNLSVDLGDTICPLVSEEQGSGSGKADLTEAEKIVSGGRAMANAENFKILHELADQIGATVGASRAAVDSGYATHDMQVGQTGKVVNPVLYIAAGISGAIQHLAGMRTSKVIVAINKDPEAPIFSKADYGIVGDLFEVVPAITEELKK